MKNKPTCTASEIFIYSFVHALIFSKHFLLVRAAGEPDPYLRNYLGGRRSFVEKLILMCVEPAEKLHTGSNLSSESNQRPFSCERGMLPVAPPLYHLFSCFEFIDGVNKE